MKEFDAFRLAFCSVLRRLRPEGGVDHVMYAAVSSCVREVARTGYHDRSGIYPRIAHETPETILAPLAGRFAEGFRARSPQ
jgi:hypothetical protein